MRRIFHLGFARVSSMAFLAFTLKLAAQTPFSDNGVTGNGNASYSQSVGAERAFVYGVTVTAPSVQLNITPGASDVILSWNTNFVGYTLQSSTNLAPGSWNAVTTQPTVIGEQNFVTNNLGAQSLFYTLIYQ
jgi:hypothetical protein